MVSPLQTSVGNDIDLSAQAVDQEGDPITFSWTGSGGSFADASAASTTYTCEEIGDHEISISVTDNDEYCDMATWTIPITCVDGGGGTGGAGGDGGGGAGGEAGAGGAGGQAGAGGAGGQAGAGGAGGQAGAGGAGGQGGMGGSVDPCEGVDCSDGNDCTEDNCMEGNCSNPPVMNDTMCDGNMGTCQSGVCVPNDLCEGVDCSDGNDCTADVCTDGNCSNPDLDVDVTCNQNGGSFCDGAGTCVECNNDSQCDIELNESCVDNTCVGVETSCGTVGGTVQIGCTNGVTTAQSPFPNQLSVTVNEPVFSGAPFTADVSGIGAFPKFFLDAAQGTVPGGVRSAVIEGFNTTMQPVNGTGDVLLQADPSGITPGLVSFCTYPASRVCTQGSDCIVPPCKPPVLVASVPISEDCAPGGFCDGIGQGPGDGATAQCNITSPPSFCVTGDLAVPLYAPGGPAVVTAGASGNVSFGWAVDPRTTTCGAGSTSTRCAANGGTLPDGALILPPSVYGNPITNPASVGLNGIRLNVANALFVALQCSDGSDGGACAGGANAGLGCANDGQCPGSTCDGVGVDDDIIVATPVADKPFCPIN